MTETTHGWEGDRRRRLAAEFTISNRLGWAIERFHYSYSFRTLGRSVPWVEDGDSRSIRGGLEPGETLIERITGLRGVPDSVDVQFEVSITRAVGAGGQPDVDARYRADELVRTRQELADLTMELRRLMVEAGVTGEDLRERDKRQEQQMEKALKELTTE